MARSRKEKNKSVYEELENELKNNKENNYEDLIRKTMVCLSAATSIQETEEYIDDITVKVKRMEFFDLPSLLLENGRFTYSYEFPDYYQNVACEQNSNDTIQINDTIVSSNNESYIEFVYERGLRTAYYA